MLSATTSIFCGALGKRWRACVAIPGKRQVRPLACARGTTLEELAPEDY